MPTSLSFQTDPLVKPPLHGKGKLNRPDGLHHTDHKRRGDRDGPNFHFPVSEGPLPGSAQLSPGVLEPVIQNVC